MAELAAQIQAYENQSQCGLRGATRIGRGEPPKFGDAVRACELPTVTEIEAACEVHEATPIPDSQDPDDPDRPLYRFPEYTVSQAQCRFSDDNHSTAICDFELASGEAAAQSVRVELANRFSTFNTPLVFGYRTRWSTESSCLPG